MDWLCRLGRAEVQVTQAFTQEVALASKVDAEMSAAMTGLRGGCHGHNSLPLHTARTILFPTTDTEVIHMSYACDGLLGDDGPRDSH